MTTNLPSGDPLVPQADAARRVAIVGGGIMGISLAYCLSRQGVASDVYEASPTLGGLAGPLELPDGTIVDRFYHAILSSDRHVQELCADLGIADQLRFKETRTSVFTAGGLHTMSTVMQLLRFPPLPIIDRFRLGLLIALAQLSRDWKALDRQSIEEWLVRLGGRSLFDRLWEPMLAAKFDGEFKELAATWMWARLVRMKSTRDGTNQRERAGHLIGGYATLLSAMARRITAAGGRIRLSCPVERVAIENQRVVGVIAGGELHRTAHVAVTMQGPILSRLIADAPADLVRGLESIRYLGIVCPLVILDRPLTGVWTVSIADKAVPFTGVIETTAYIDPQYVGGHHLVYLPKYTAGDSPWQRMTDDEVREACLATLEKMFPTFSRVHVRYVLVHRERYAEPLHTVAAPPLPGVQTAVRGLYLATTAQIYPQIAAGESVTRHASTAADLISNSLSIESRALPQPAAGTAMRSTTSHDIRQPVPSFGRTS